MHASGFPDTNRDPRNLRLSNESRARIALELNNLVCEILQGVDQLGARQHPCTVCDLCFCWRCTHAKEAGLNCNSAWHMSCGGLGCSALGSALTFLHERGRGDPGKLESYWQQGSADPKPWTELLWRMPQDSVLRRYLTGQDPHTRPHCGLWIWLGRSRSQCHSGVRPRRDPESVLHQDPARSLGEAGATTSM